MPEYECNIVEMIKPGAGEDRFIDFVEEHLPDIDKTIKDQFVAEYIKVAIGRRSAIVRG